ncbi:MAG: hypothetical protein V1660_01370 [archaeon]
MGEHKSLSASMPKQHCCHQKYRANSLKRIIIVGAILLCTKSGFCAGEKINIVENIVGIGSAQASVVSPEAIAPSYIIPNNIDLRMNPQIKPFLNYANYPYSLREPSREDFESASFIGNLWKGYYNVDDKKEEIEERINAPMNNSLLKNNFNIEKVSTKIDRDTLRFNVKFRKTGKLEKVFAVEVKPKKYLAKFLIKF